MLLSAPTVGEDWPQFRGPRRDNISGQTGLLRKWPEGGPRVLWSVEVCEGYAAAAIHSGRVYFEDYLRDQKEWCLRCLSLADGKELWRFTESKTIRPNHGITRTVPAVDSQYVFSLDPKCVFRCLDAATGRQLWRKDLVEEYKVQIPPWYNGQCPLIEPDRVVIGVGGKALLIAVDKATGNEIWRTPNPEGWPMAHASVMPATLGGVKQYLWCTLFGLVGVRADDGQLLWHHPRKFNLAVAPSPLPADDDRVFMTAGYDAGSVMLRVKNHSEGFSTETLFDLSADQWNSEVHTPILYRDHLFAVGREKRGLFTCLDLSGRTVWTSEGRATFDLGSFILADGMFLVLEGKTGTLRLLEANTSEYRELDSAQVLSGDNVWGPMALSDGKLVLRDMTKMVCIEVAAERSSAAARDDLSMGRESRTAYRRLRAFGGKGSGPGRFEGELRGLCIQEDRVYAVGDSKLTVFWLEGEALRSWDTDKPGYSVAVAADGDVYVGQEGQVQVFDRDGKPLADWRDDERLGLVTAVGLIGDQVLLADVRGRCIRRYDRGGKWHSDIGKDNRMRGFLVPNQHLDLAVDADRVIYVANAGMHRVERYSLDGELLGHFGRFDGRDPAGFPGCCNPTNLALTPTGQVVVTEKAGPRVKVYDSDGKLRSTMGERDLDPSCKNMDVAVDSAGRIYVIDTVRLEIAVYGPDGAPAPASAPSTPEAQP
jgi:outer membrane protein assembly factor BamB